MKAVEGKVAVVTGGARGIGAATARWLAAEGAAVVVADVLDEEGGATAEGIRDEGGTADFVSLDVTDEAGWAWFVAHVTDAYGRLDILVNNAGVNLRGGILATDAAALDRVLRVNLLGPFLGMRAAATAMRAQGGGGAIVNVVSGAALFASPSAAYGASKWALRGLTQTASLEFGPLGVRVNAVHPGAISTEMSRAAGGDEVAAAFERITPSARLGTPGEAAAVIGFLCSDAAAFVNGAEIVIDGGFVAGAPMAGIAALAAAGPGPARGA